MSDAYTAAMSTLSSTVRQLGSRLELFIDHYLIDSLTDAWLQLQKPQNAGIALKFDAPWEGLFAGVVTVLKDGADYRMYYRGKPDAKEDGADNEVTCYAHSTDGINWTKPQLRLFDHHGRDNNIILDNSIVTAHNFSPFLDTNPQARSDERYKGVAGIHPRGVFALASPDGVHWRRLQDEPIITSQAFAFDSQNVPFLSVNEGCYVFYFRTWIAHPDGEGSLGFRWISRSTSQDFLHWTEPVQMEMGDAPLEHLYINQTYPYFRAPHIYIGLAARFWPQKKVLTDEQAVEIGVAPEYYDDCSDGVLLTSRGGNHYDRTFLESFMRPGPGLENWVSRTNYPGLGIVPTGAGEISLFSHRHYAQATCHVGRFTLRTDGFAAVNAPYSGGEMLTHSLTFTGRELILNYSTSAAGSIRVEIQEPAGQPLAGFGLNDCASIVGDEICRVVRWNSNSDLSHLQGKIVRLRFVMHDADLYSLQFK